VAEIFQGNKTTGIFLIHSQALFSRFAFHCSAYIAEFHKPENMSASMGGTPLPPGRRAFILVVKSDATMSLLSKWPGTIFGI
jgi:hypothetical protein